MAGHPVHVGAGIPHPTPPYGPARSRTRRLRANLVHHLITYAVWCTYLGVGVGVAAANGYLDRLGSVASVATAAGAVLLWPLVFLE